MIAVKALSAKQMEEGVLSKAAKEEHPPGVQGASWWKHPKTKDKPEKKRIHSTQGAMRNKVLTLLLGLSDEDGMTSMEMANHFGLPVGAKQRKPLQNALHNMFKADLVRHLPPSKEDRTNSHVYVLSAKGAQIARQLPANGAKR